MIDAESWMQRLAPYLLFLFAVSPGSPVAQSSASLRFEVASIKPESGSGIEMVSGGPGSSDSERVTFQRTTLQTLICHVYHVGVAQLSGPSWLGTERYTINAKLPPGTNTAQYVQMLANLLTDRFHLALHMVKKQAAVYELLVAPGGPKLTPAASAPSTAGLASTDAPVGPPAVDVNKFPVLGDRPGWATRFDGDVSRFTFRGVSLDILANALGLSASGAFPGQVRVADRTGLAGKFDFHLEVDGDPSQGLSVSGISAALKKQLGLQLTRTVMDTDFLVVDHVDKVPTPD